MCDFVRDNGAFTVFAKSVVITLSAIALVLIGYFAAGFLSGRHGQASGDCRSKGGGEDSRDWKR